MLIDTHTHLDFEHYRQDRDQVIEAAREAGVTALIDVGIDLKTSERALALSRRRKGIYATVGVHPHHAQDADEKVFERLRQLALDPAHHVVAIGEIGLDFYRNLSPRAQQEHAFRRQIDLAKQCRLPVVVHDREAHQEVLRILEEEGADETGGVLHCFSGDMEVARRALKLGFYLSFAGPVTYRKSSELRRVARMVPSDRLLVETDCPFLAPEPFRGKRNEPAFLARVVETIAEVRGVARHRLEELTTVNARLLFGIYDEL